MEVEREVAKWEGFKICWTDVKKLIYCKNTKRCGTTAYYSLNNNVGHSISEPLTLHLLNYV